MKEKPFVLIISMILMMVVSCDEPETVVTNYVHPDGSITRKIEMRNVKNIFKTAQVPYDSTWTLKDSIEIGAKGDTVWIKRAEKLFNNVEEINLVYRLDTGANKIASRHAGFSKRFKWFNTEFRFSEKIEKVLTYGYPIKDFLSVDELLYFYSPESLNNKNESGPDSLKYKMLRDSVKIKTDNWLIKNLVSEWIGIFSKLTEAKDGNDLIRESLKGREEEFVKIIEPTIYEDEFDSLWTNGILLRKCLGEANALKYKIEADTALEIVDKYFFVDFKDYSVRVVMPGKLIGTNGFIDSSQVLLWPVTSAYFLTEPYEMWAESKIPNTWAWIVSGLFLAFVFTGVIIRLIKKG
jgi:hypothetical protein